MIFFGTGVGNPIGNMVAPTVKVCGNVNTLRTMADNIDVDVSGILGVRREGGGSRRSAVRLRDRGRLGHADLERGARRARDRDQPIRADALAEDAAMKTKLSRVTEAIVRKIESGALREGDRLPSEEELAATLSRQRRHDPEGARGPCALGAHFAPARPRHVRVADTSVAPADVRYLRFRRRRRQRSLLVRRTSSRSLGARAPGPWSEFLGEGERRPDRRLDQRRRPLRSLQRVLAAQRTTSRGSEASTGARWRATCASSSASRLALPTLRVDQWIRFQPLPATVARWLGLVRHDPGFVMELRGYTLRDRPLSYQMRVLGPVLRAPRRRAVARGTDAGSMMGAYDALALERWTARRIRVRAACRASRRRARRGDASCAASCAATRRTA